jgi:hypothetical protein
VWRSEDGGSLSPTHSAATASSASSDDYMVDQQPLGNSAAHKLPSTSWPCHDRRS